MKCMSSKETIILLLKELEQDIIALEEEIIKKTENEVNDTIAEFAYTIKKESRKMDMDMAVIQTKMNGIFSGNQDSQIAAYKLAHLT